MKKLLICLFVLAGCASEPPQPTQAQLALIAYYADLCKRQGADVNDDAVLKGCIMRNYQIDVSSGLYGRQPTIADAVQGMSNVYGSAVRPTCYTSPDYRGGFTTACY